MIAIDFNDVEASIQYEFKNKSILKQAFMMTENENIPFSSEVLRTIGKRTINYSLTQILIGDFGYYNDKKLFRTSYTNEAFNDLLNNLYSKDIFARNVELLGLSKYLDFDNNTDPFNLDRKLFEAIIGAVTIDSNWNMNVVNEVLSFMLDIDYYIENGVNDLNKNYVVIVHNWAIENSDSLPIYEYLSVDSNVVEFESKLHLFIKGTDISFSATEGTKAKARMQAAKKAYEYLIQNNLIKTIQNVDIKPDKKIAMKQLEDLAIKGYFSLPEFDVITKNNKYVATCSVDECDLQFKGEGELDEIAINEAAFKMLNHLLGLDL